MNKILLLIFVIISFVALCFLLIVFLKNLVDNQEKEKELLIKQIVYEVRREIIKTLVTDIGVQGFVNKKIRNDQK